MKTDKFFYSAKIKTYHWNPNKNEIEVTLTKVETVVLYCTANSERVSPFLTVYSILAIFYILLSTLAALTIDFIASAILLPSS